MDAQLISFPAARYRFDFTVQTPIRLHEYAGSALRGAFGRSLRHIACVTREKDCKACALYRSCPYPAVFETPAPESHRLQKFSQIPNPYVIEPPPWGERTYHPGDIFSFHMVVIGQALRHLPLIFHAWQRALAHSVGPADGTAALDTVWHCLPDADTCVFDARDGKLAAHDAYLPPVPAAQLAQDSTTLVFQTQLRLQQNGRPLRANEVTPQRLLVGLVKRAALIAEFHTPHTLDLDFHALADKSAAIKQQHQLAWRDWTRYSSRQQQEMKLGGVIGTWQLAGDLQPFWPFLHLGQWLHVGKNATFGLGQYSLRD